MVLASAKSNSKHTFEKEAFGTTLSEGSWETTELYL